MKVKVELKDLKKAIDWLEINSNELFVWVDVEGRELSITTLDRQEKQAAIVIYSDGNMLPKITRTEVL